MEKLFRTAFLQCFKPMKWLFLRHLSQHLGQQIFLEPLLCTAVEGALKIFHDWRVNSRVGWMGFSFPINTYSLPIPSNNPASFPDGLKPFSSSSNSENLAILHTRLDQRLVFKNRGTWVAQLVGCLTLAQVMISLFVGLSPISGSVLTARSLEPASWILCFPLSLSAPALLVLSLFLSLKNKQTYKNF